jgi:hypothetical protein
MTLKQVLCIPGQDVKFVEKIIGTNAALNVVLLLMRFTRMNVNSNSGYMEATMPITKLLSNGLPEYIVATRKITYDVREIMQSYKDVWGDTPNAHDVISLISDWVIEDLSCGWGHTTDIDNINLTDIHGNEVRF